MMHALWMPYKKGPPSTTSNTEEINTHTHKLLIYEWLFQILIVICHICN